MYHAISPPPAGNPYPDLFVPEAEFEKQMRWLADHGYHGVTLDQVWAAWKQGASVPSKPVVVSFDDGLASQYVGARPILTQLGWPAVLNLEIDHVLQGEMTPSMIRDLIGDGWELDSHTFTHPDVTTLDAAGLKREISDSRRWLQQHFDVPVNFFCYPAGAYDAAAIAAVKAAGYEGATTTEEGLASPSGDPFTLKRIRVGPGDETAGLAEKLRSG
jgi:peptidoglycan/xylan/chitin deacetylase (PgdA/CDA1 family)